MNGLRLAFGVLLCAASARAAEWPQWLGPTRDTAAKDVVQPWTASPAVVWRAAVGEGHSSPLVADGKVFLHYHVTGKDEERLAAFDAHDGKELGSIVHARSAFRGRFGAGPRATPTIAPDGQVISYGVTGILSGGQLGESKASPKSWSVDMLYQFHAKDLRFGVSGSPLVDGNRVIVPVGGKGSSIVAVDRTSGQVVWKALDDAACYASPIAVEQAGKRVVIALTAEGVVGLGADDGSVVWQFPFKDTLQESSTTPVKIGDLIVVSSVTLGSIGLKLTSKDGKPAIESAWKNPQLACYFSTPVAAGNGQIFMVTSSMEAMLRRQPQADLCCVDAATGKLLWKHEKAGRYHAALVRMGDGKLLMHSDTGDLFLLDPDPKEFQELAKSKVCGQTRAHPAVADGRIYLRDDKELLCIQLPH
jgi:outer membrane protein assembly factor BamB